MPLILDTASAAHEKKLHVSEDACLLSVPDARSTKKPALLAIASNLAGRSDKGEAARCAIESLRESFYAAPRDWEPKLALKESFHLANQAVSSGGKNRAATLSVLTLIGRQWSFGHLGNTRIWLYRDQKVKLLTHDHMELRMGTDPVITQACGLRNQIDLNTGTGDIRQNDVFILTTSGVHDVLNSSLIMGCAMKSESAQEVADGIIRLAKSAGSLDEMTVCVAIVDMIPDPKEKSATKVTDNISALPIGPLPEPGTVIDGFEVKRVTHNSLTTVVYKCIDEKTGNAVALRFPNPKFADDSEFIDAFLREEWIGKQHDNPHLIKVKSMAGRKRSVLYSLLEYHRGESLAKRMRRKKQLSVRETVYLANQLLDCLEYLHEKGITHRDINPGNIFVDKENKRILLTGFGLSSIEKLQDAGAEMPGQQNRGYQAPEILQGHESDKRADIYSTGVTIYKMLTAKYPYGRINSITDRTFIKSIDPVQYNKNIPGWLSEVIQKACSAKPDDRFGSAASFAAALNIPEDDMDQKKNQKGSFAKRLFSKVVPKKK